MSEMTGCTLCPRQCSVQRTETVGAGVCGVGTMPRIARAALHMWEEPCISGTRGSGTVFFSGCGLKCIFCLNESISHGGEGEYVSVQRLAEIFRELEAQGLDYESIKVQVMDYANHNHTLFCLQSMTNLARNGRVHPAVAKIAGMLNIRVVGDVKGGEITPVHKPRGDKKAIQAMVEMMGERGLQDGNLVRIAHCYGETAANALVAAVKEQYPNCRFMIEPTTALCSFYAEAGGLIIGFEGSFNENNDNRKF